MNKGQQLLTMTPSGQDSNTEQDLCNLQDKWESVQAKVAERKVGNVKWHEVALLGYDGMNQCFSSRMGPHS